MILKSTKKKSSQTLINNWINERKLLTKNTETPQEMIKYINRLKSYKININIHDLHSQILLNLSTWVGQDIAAIIHSFTFDDL